MAALDLILLAVALTAAALWQAWPGGKRRRLIGAGLAAAALLLIGQAVSEGLLWQAAPVALLVGALAVGVLRPPAAGWRRWAARAVVAVLAVAAIAAWSSFLPVPRLARPTGPYAVGARTFRWIDPARPEAGGASGERRNVVVEVFYPAASGAKGASPPYIDGLGKLPARVSLIPRFAMAHFDRIDTFAVAGAAVSTDRASWPLILFSPGYGAPRAYYTGLITDLASRGFVVAALDHPYESAVTQLADGRIVTPSDARQPFPRSEAAQMAFMAAQQSVRAADLRFALDRLLTPEASAGLAARIDSSRVAAAGHSFGGAAAIQAAQADPRLRAAINVDGTLYGDIARRPLAQSFLLLQSDKAQTHHGDRFEDGAARLLAGATGPAFRYSLLRANHFSFTDAPLFLAPPSRWLLSQLIGGQRGVRDTQAASADLIAAFLADSFDGPNGRLAAAAARRHGVTGGPAAH